MSGVVDSGLVFVVRGIRVGVSVEKDGHDFLAFLFNDDKEGSPNI